MSRGFGFIEKAVTQMEHVTAAERSAGRLEEDKLQRLQAEFDEVGWCRLGSLVVDPALLGRLEGALDRAAAEQLLAKGPEAWVTTRSMGPLLPRIQHTKGHHGGAYRTNHTSVLKYSAVP